MRALDYLEDFAARVVQDALTEATAAYWLRRAEQLEAARPRPGDFTGRATVAEIAERDRRLAVMAENCRHHAALVADPSLWSEEMAEQLEVGR